VVEKVHPTIIVGTSTVGGAFTEQVVREMAKHANRPMIFPLSNPTERIEARPADVIHWTDGRGLVGTGTPWAPVPYKGIDYRIGQANNALVYPGIGLGTIVSRAEHVTDGMLLASAEAVASLVDTNQPGAGLLPDVENLRAASATVAVAVARQAVADGIASPLDDPVQAVQDAMWRAAYGPVEVK
jgi:malate dehydrogenase (oxaloacetate-decarboxylating)